VKYGVVSGENTKPWKNQKRRSFSEGGINNNLHYKIEEKGLVID